MAERERLNSMIASSNAGMLKPDELTKGGERRYKLETLKNINKNIIFNNDNLKTIVCSNG